MEQERTTYFQYIAELLNNLPFLLLKLIFPHFPITRNLINGLAVFEREYKHVVR